MTETALHTGRVEAAVEARVAIVEDHDLLAQSLGYALSNLGIHVTTVADLHAEAVLETLEACTSCVRSPTSGCGS